MNSTVPVEAVLILLISKAPVSVSLPLPFTVMFAPFSTVRFVVLSIVTSVVITGFLGEEVGIFIVSELKGTELPNQLPSVFQSLLTAPVQIISPAVGVTVVPLPPVATRVGSTSVCVTISPLFVTAPSLPVSVPVEMLPVEFTVICRVATSYI